MISVNGFVVQPLMFPDGTSQVWKLPHKLLSEAAHLHLGGEVIWKFEHEGEFMQMAQIKFLLNKHGIESSLTLPYLPYARQDKPTANDATFALRPFAYLLNSLSFKSVAIMDPHSEVALELIDNAVALWPFKEVRQVFAQQGSDIVCYPDKGALVKYTKLFPELPFMHGEKNRDPITGNILSYQIMGDPKGQNVLIIDDICDGGMTFRLLAKDLLNAGAKQIDLFVTHGIFSKGLKVLLDAGITSVFTKEGQVVLVPKDAIVEPDPLNVARRVFLQY